MSDQIQELMDIPRDFIQDGTQFINRCTKRMDSPCRIATLMQYLAGVEALESSFWAHFIFACADPF